MIPLIVWIVCSVCFMIGGLCNLTFRREIMTWIILIYCLWLTNTAWMFCQLSSEGVMHLGYGDKSVFRHIFGDGWGRGVWSLLVGLGLALPLLLTGHMILWVGILYLIACFFSEPLFKNLWQVAGDLLIGAVIGSIVFIIH